MRVSFWEEPITWLGVKTWPFVMLRSRARLHGYFVLAAILVAISSLVRSIIT